MSGGGNPKRELDTRLAGVGAIASRSFRAHASCDHHGNASVAVSTGDL